MTEDSMVDNIEEFSSGMVLKYAVFDVASYHVIALVESEVSRRATYIRQRGWTHGTHDSISWALHHLCCLRRKMLAL